ncbi:response regulator [Bradyrhizobium sp.]|uniref:response regulator n=1 Tax=Bradyrhizobium sp. TaxID=376 RepID=UPI001DA344D2|nr:response regulator [Bradyrhizobium sp.]MBV8701244.1 response regulator [Bradyrhizobium sp.]MBV8923004.1 response regulator [Bradyrhizobium sp.]MBV9982211.1 response regulator [Bradyrhizobium sp.]
MRNELLAIEDAELHLSILRKIAAQAGFTTTSANSLDSAASLLEQRSFGVITLDLSLGEQSGIEILKLLARMKCGTPVLVISASDDDALSDVVRIGNDFNLNLYPPIPKPINLAVLRQALLQIAGDAARHDLATAGET